MAYDGIVTKSIIAELKNTIINGKINKVFEPNKNEIILGIYSSGKNYALNICIESSNCRMHLTTHSKPNPHNALNFCMLLRKHIIGYKIKNIYSIGLERIVYLELEGYNEFNDLTKKTLIVELMGKHSNVILVNDKNFIIDAIRHLDTTSHSNRDILPAHEYVLPLTNKLNFLDVKQFNEFYEKILDKENTIDKAICSIYTGFSMSFVQNALKRFNIKNDNFESNNLVELYQYFKDLLNYIDNVTGEFLDLTTSPNKTKIDFVPCLKISYDNQEVASTPLIEPKQASLDFNFFIDDFYYNKEQKEQFNYKRNNILKVILVYLKKYQKRLQNINKKLKECENKETYQLYGELITSNLYRIKNTNEDKIQLENYYDNNNLITIPLDKKYSVANNAKRYFKKYNKLKNALEICAIQKKETELELDYIESVVYELENSTTSADLEQIYSEISESSIFKDSFNKQKNNKKKQNVPSSIQPIQLNIDGFAVYVGKNNICNDYLTTKLANKNDLWFHTKDIHGSHVVLNLENKTPNNEIIQKCAELAAYHSKAKLSSNVPVDYCYIKYVKKPSKSKAGMVIYTHNKTLFVNPRKY